MVLPAGLRELPGNLVPQALAAAVSERDLAELVFEERRCENLAYCRTMTSVYALYRTMYADDEAEYLAGPGDYATALEARRRLSAAQEALEAQVSTLLRLGPTAAPHAIDTAVAFIERLPKVFALIGESVISPKAGQVALARSQVLTAAQARAFDEALAERLTRQYEVLSLPALTEVVNLLVQQTDPDAAERRRRAALSDRRITFRPEQDGMAAAFALLPAHDMLEFSARVDHIAGTVCEGDPRTLPQRRADGTMQLIRGFSTLGCECETDGCRYREARYDGEPDADGVVVRFITMVNVVVNERDADTPDGGAAAPASAAHPTDEPANAHPRTTGESDGAAERGSSRAEARDPHESRGNGAAPRSLGYLIGYGPISGEYARELAARGDAKVRPFGRPITNGDLPEPTAPGPRDPVAPEPAPRGPAPAVHATLAPRCTLDVTRAWARVVFDFEPHRGPDDWPQAPDGGPPPDGDPDGPGAGAGSNHPDDFASSPPGAQEPRSHESRGLGPRSLGHPDDAGTDQAATPTALVRARGSAGYRPSADQRRYLRLMYPRCVFPHCNRPSSRAQIDHRREYDHRTPDLGGRTTADALQPLCVAHHQLKTAGQWIDARLPDGRILWTSPGGRRYIVDPTGIVLELFPDLARVEWAVPGQAGGAPSNPEPARPGGRTRLQREHARRELLRRRNVAAFEAERAERAQPRSEIESRLRYRAGAPRPLPQPHDDAEPPPF